MKRYLVYSPNTGLELACAFVQAGEGLQAALRLCGVSADLLSAEPGALQMAMRFLCNHVETEMDLVAMAKQYDWRLTALGAPPDFEAFWETYNNKVDKKRARDKWERLSETEQARAFAYIGRYHAQVRERGVAMMYAKTYLQNKVWNE